MPLPFTRILEFEDPQMTGNDVFILQNLIIRSPDVVPKLYADSVFGKETAVAVGQFQVGGGGSGGGGGGFYCFLGEFVYPLLCWHY